MIGSMYEGPRVFDARPVESAPPEPEPVEEPAEVKRAGIAFEALAAEEPGLEPDSESAAEMVPDPEARA